MKVNYDKEMDAMYIRLREGKIKGTIKVHDRLMVDVDSKGNTVGVEVLDVSLQLSRKEAVGLENRTIRNIPIAISEVVPVTI